MCFSAGGAEELARTGRGKIRWPRAGAAKAAATNAESPANCAGLHLRTASRALGRTLDSPAIVLPLSRRSLPGEGAGGRGPLRPQRLVLRVDRRGGRLGLGLLLG